MTLPTPGEMAFRLGLRSDMPFDPPRVIEATIRADREAIAKVVEEMMSQDRFRFEASQAGDQPERRGHYNALLEIFLLLRPQNKKGEPPLDDSPTAPLV